MPDLAAVFFARFHQPELRSSGEGSFSRGDAEGAENFLQITELQGFAPPGSQLFRSNFGFQDQWRGPLGAGQAAWGRRCGAALVIPVDDRVAPPVSSQRVRAGLWAPDLSLLSRLRASISPGNNPPESGCGRPCGADGPQTPSFRFGN
jgi:hypothetical protein